MSSPTGSGASMVKWQWDDTEIRRNIEKLDRETKVAVNTAFEFQAARSTAYMKTHAPWTDRTGAARSGLHATTSFGAKSWELVLSHAVSYGIWLEVANSGRYQIILPSLRQAAEELQKMINGLWKRL